MTAVLSALSASTVHRLLDEAVIVDGPNPWDPQIHSSNFYEMVASDGLLGLGDAYVKGLWQCDDLFGFFCRTIRAGLLETMASAAAMQNLMKLFQTTNRQTLAEAERNVLAHYDKGNDLFEATLDPTTMAYTCARWDNPHDEDFEDRQTLDQAQGDKLDLICLKLGLESGMRVLDIGCGWGPFMRHAAGNFDVEVVGITLSANQISWIEEHTDGLPIKAIKADYREFDQGQFDRVVSVGMLEHVGDQNLRAFMEAVNRNLRLDGLALVHCFGKSDPEVPLIDPFTERYIFPGMELPTPVRILSAAEGIFNILDLEEMGQHYPKTLLAWNQNFQLNWETISSKYGKEFKRMWEYYLLSCAAAFRVRKALLWQMVFTQKGNENLYSPVR